MTLDTAATILILGIAAYRLARILPVDEIAQPVRDRITLWTYPDKPEITAKETAQRKWVGKLLACPVCLGWWISPVVVVFYSLVIVGEWFGWGFLIWWPAVAGVGAIAALRVDGASEVDVRLIPEPKPVETA
jgi:hypothetical protein